jgi:hypothetical protein
MINECLILYDLKNYNQFFANAHKLLFQNLFFVLEPENVNGNIFQKARFYISIFVDD